MKTINNNLENTRQYVTLSFQILTVAAPKALCGSFTVDDWQEEEETWD